MSELLWLLFTIGSCAYVGSLLASFLAWLMLG